MKTRFSVAALGSLPLIAPAGLGLDFLGSELSMVASGADPLLESFGEKAADIKSRPMY
jgi:hypothetical protein